MELFSAFAAVILAGLLILLFIVALHDAGHVETFIPQWVVTITFGLILYFLFKENVNAVKSTVDATSAILTYVVVGAVYAVAALLLKTFLISRKMKALIAEQRKKGASVRREYAEVENFSKSILRTSNPLILIETNVIKQDLKEGVLSYTVTASGITSNIVIALINWTVFWPLYMISFLVRDALTFIVEAFVNTFSGAYNRLLRSLFSVDNK